MDKEIFGRLGNAISDASKELAKKTKETADTSKLSLKVSGEKSTLKKKYEVLGQVYYKQHIEGNVEDVEIDAICNSVKKTIDRIKDYNKEIQKIKGVPICFMCGKGISDQIFFCNHCGHRTERELAQIEEEENRSRAYRDAEVAEGKVCSKCRKHAGMDDYFCTTCGNKIREKDE